MRTIRERRFGRLAWAFAPLLAIILVAGAPSDYAAGVGPATRGGEDQGPAKKKE